MYDPSTVEITGPWATPQRSNTLQNLGCAEFAPNSLGGLSIRDTKLGANSPILNFDATEIHALFHDVRAGRFSQFDEAPKSA